MITLNGKKAHQATGREVVFGAPIMDEESKTALKAALDEVILSTFVETEALPDLKRLIDFAREHANTHGYAHASISELGKYTRQYLAEARSDLKGS